MSLPVRFRGSHLLPPFAEATVADVLHRGILACPPDATLREVAEILATHHVHCVVVDGVERDQQGGERLVWRVLDDLDLARALSDPANHGARAGDVATGSGAAVAPSDSLVEAAAEMVAHGLTHLVVASERHGRPVGVVSALDLAAALAWGAHPGQTA